jgi:asparagine synthase (glutamine-hydrolysing)
MGAIFAVLTRDGGAPDPERLRRGLEAIRPWGSGRAELWSEGGVAIGAAPRDDEPGAAPEPLPLTLHEAPEVRAAVDATLADRDRLGRALGAPPTATDAELVLRAYLRWDESAPAHLTGPFAFAIWDG